MTQASVPPHPSSPAWPCALRRGATLGVVASFHLALLAVLLRPAEYREAREPVPRGADDALQLFFMAAPAKPAPVAKAPTPPPRRRSSASAPQPQRTEIRPSTPIHAAPTIVSSLPPAPTTGPATPDDQPGDFHARLREAQRSRAVPLPGAATPRVGGFALRVTPSVQEIVRRLAAGTRCTAMQFDMQKKIVTAQLMNRLLEADGCGPHAERTPTTEAVDALTRQLMDER